MISYIYQVQRLHRGRWLPVFLYNSSTPLESQDLDYIMDEARLLASRFDGIRVIKNEQYLIDDFSN